MRVCLIIMVLLTCIGCESEQQAEEAEFIVSTPFEHDPTHEFDVIGWWKSTSELLHLREEHSFTLYDRPYPSEAVAEYGKWRQQNYATLWLEIYDELAPDPIRVNIERSAGLLTLRIEGRAPMLTAPEPIRVSHDHLVGFWKGASTTLLLRADSRYEFSLSGGVASHGGSWGVEGKTLTLTPDSPPAIDPGPIRIDEQEIGIQLLSDHDALRRSVTGRNEPSR